MKKLLLLFAALTSIYSFLITNSYSQESNSWYIGAGFGGTEIESDIVIWKQVLADKAKFDERNTGYKFFGGYQWNDYIGIEALFADFGELELIGNSGHQFISGGKMWTFTQDNVEIITEMKTIATGLSFSFPIKNFSDNKILKRITPYCLVGGHYWDLNMSASPHDGTDQTDSIKNDNDFDFFYSAGLNIDITSHINLRLEYNFFNCSDVIVEDIDFICGSIIYTF